MKNKKTRALACLLCSSMLVAPLTSSVFANEGVVYADPNAEPALYFYQVHELESLLPEHYADILAAYSDYVCYDEAIRVEIDSYLMEPDTMESLAINAVLNLPDCDYETQQISAVYIQLMLENAAKYNYPFEEGVYELFSQFTPIEKEEEEEQDPGVDLPPVQIEDENQPSGEVTLPDVEVTESEEPSKPMENPDDSSNSNVFVDEEPVISEDDSQKEETPAPEGSDNNSNVPEDAGGITGNKPDTEDKTASVLPKDPANPAVSNPKLETGTKHSLKDLIASSTGDSTSQKNSGLGSAAASVSGNSSSSSSSKKTSLSAAAAAAAAVVSSKVQPLPTPSKSMVFTSLGHGINRKIDVKGLGSYNLLPDFTNNSAWKNSGSTYNTPYLWGQCTWFAWGRFYEIYGYDPGFTGNGYDCAKQLVNAHPESFKLSRTPAAGAIFSGDKAHNHVGIVLDYDEKKDMLTVQEGNLDGVSNTTWTKAIDDYRTITVSPDQLRNMYGDVVYAIPTQSISKAHKLSELVHKSLREKVLEAMKEAYARKEQEAMELASRQTKSSKTETKTSKTETKTTSGKV